jgi:hypothetical protein
MTKGSRETKLIAVCENHEILHSAFIAVGEEYSVQNDKLWFDNYYFK